MSASKNLGKVFMTPKGVWNKALNYTKLDIVTNKVGKISCGYIATTDIEKNVEITDNRWLKLFELLDGDLTEEYKAVQTDVTNKATDVDTNKKAVDLIYSQMQKLYDVEISTTTPTNERTGLWINPDDISGVVNIPEIKDDEVSDVDTWSSKKIDNVTNSLKEDISTKITKFYASSQGKTHLADSDNGKIQDMMLYGKSSQDGTPTPENPVEIKSVVNPTVKVWGKNLLNYNAWKGTPITRGTAIYENNGITLTATENDCYSEMGNNFPDNAKIKVSEGETLTLSWEQIENNKEGYIYIFGNGIASNSVNIDNRKSKKLSYTVPSGVTFITFRFGVAATGDTISYKNIQIEKGSEATSYEPYHDEQTLTLPYTLNAIPVSSGGNVTIDGQQYIADYVDVERGKLVRHIKEKSDTISIAVTVSVGGLGIYDYDIPFIKNVICNITNIVYEDVNKGWASKQACISGSNAGELRVYLPVGNHNVKIIYELETQEEIDLTPEEIAAFKALATYYPTTNISINSEQLDGYTVFNYPISMQNGWNYVKQQIGDTREYIYDIDARTQDTDLQAAEAYVNSEYAVALTELEV